MNHKYKFYLNNEVIKIKNNDKFLHLTQIMSFIRLKLGILFKIPIII